MPTISPQRFVLKITLDHTEPAIWRRFRVPGSLTMEDLHFVIQDVMGWENTHMHIFRQGKTFICMPDDDSLNWADPSVDYKYLREDQVAVSEVFTRKGRKLAYEYDFGDDWKHTLVLEEVTAGEEGDDCPVCLDGAMACPPEDCGGIYGYQQILEAIATDDEEMLEELEELYENYDPKAFHVKTINQILGTGWKAQKAKPAGKKKTPGKKKAER
jgi:hypothetical protein